MFTPKNYRYMFRNDLEAFPHYRHTPNLQTKKGQMHLFSQQKDAFVLVCFICLFLSNLTELFLFFLKPEKERKCRTNQ